MITFAYQPALRPALPCVYGPLDYRDQEIIYLIFKDLLRDYCSDEKSGAPAFEHFHAVKAIVGDWHDKRVRAVGKDARCKKLLYYGDRDGGRKDTSLQIPSMERFLDRHGGTAKQETRGGLGITHPH